MKRMRVGRIKEKHYSLIRRRQPASGSESGGVRRGTLRHVA